MLACGRIYGSESRPHKRSVAEKCEVKRACWKTYAQLLSTGAANFYPVNPGSDFPDEVKHPFAKTDPRDFEMVPHFWDMYTRTHLLHDTWNTSGFVSEVPINSDVFVRQAGCFGTYKYVITTSAVK